MAEHKFLRLTFNTKAIDLLFKNLLLRDLLAKT